MLLGLMSMILESVALRAGECIMSISGWRVQAISANLPAWNLLSVSTKMTGPSNLSNAGGRFISHVFLKKDCFQSLRGACMHGAHPPHATGAAARSAIWKQSWLFPTPAGPT